MKTFLLGVPHLLSPEELIFQGCPPYLSSGQSSPWELDHPKFLQTPHLANLGPLCLIPDLKPWKLIFLCNQAWPQYPLDNASKWPLNGTFNLNMLRDLYNFCECTDKWKEIPYAQFFSYLHTKPSLCISCSPAQVLLASKPAFSWDSNRRVEVSCCWKCSSTSQWEQPRGTCDC
jgi:hypothetical protein